MENEAIGRKIRILRLRLDLTSSDLARMVGISQAQVSRLENGKQGFRSATLSRIAEALGVHPVFFFMNDYDMESSGKLDEAAVVYAAVAHPRLADALQSPRFLSVIEKLASAYLADGLSFRSVSRAIRSIAEEKKGSKSS